MEGKTRVWWEKLHDGKCPFCTYEKLGAKIIFETIHFVFLDNRNSPTLHHSILFPRHHIETEADIDRFAGNEYVHATEKAFEYLKEKTGVYPFVFINPPQQQTATHFHKHFYPGVFNPKEVESALRELYLKHGKKA